MSHARAAAVMAALACLAGAAEPAERLADPSREARARSLFRETRCLVCQGESIDDSESTFAADLRRLVRQQVAEGRSDAQVRAFLAARYGDFVLLRPPFSAVNAILWVGPFLVICIGATILVRRARTAPSAAPLSAEEETRLASLTEETMT